MASGLDNIGFAAFQIGQSADETQQRTLICADTLKTQATQLAAIVGQRSRSGQDAVRQVQQAERAVRECAARLLTLQSTVDRFVNDLEK